ncbi:MAG TPA: hypothetical protein G4N98_09400 [Thermoflexia bacterium]|nr:hypothetical protein [Thermoflexia bacterium]
MRLDKGQQVGQPVEVACFAREGVLHPAALPAHASVLRRADEPGRAARAAVGRRASATGGGIGPLRPKGAVQHVTGEDPAVMDDEIGQQRAGY